MNRKHYEEGQAGNCNRCILAQAIADYLQIPCRAVLVSGCHVEIVPDIHANPPQFATFYPRGGKNLEGPFNALHFGVVNRFDEGKTFEEIEEFLHDEPIEYEFLHYTPAYPEAVL